jgi:hypothetical protein
MPRLRAARSRQQRLPAAIRRLLFSGKHAQISNEKFYVSEYDILQTSDLSNVTRKLYLMCYEPTDERLEYVLAIVIR